MTLERISKLAANSFQGHFDGRDGRDWGRSCRIAKLTTKLVSRYLFRGDFAAEETKYIAEITNEFNLAYLHFMRADFFGIQKDIDIVMMAREIFAERARSTNEQTNT